MTKKWFEPDPSNFPFLMRAIDSKNSILGSHGWGGPELNGHKAALFVEGKVLIFFACREVIRDASGKQIWTEDGKKAYGERWYDVHFEYKGAGFTDKNFQEQEYIADKWLSNQDHQQAVEIAVDYIQNYGLRKKDLPVSRLIQFSKRISKLNDRNPVDVIEVNQNAY